MTAEDVVVLTMDVHNVDTLAFWDRIDADGDCWLWLGPLRSDGYGKVAGSTAHIVAWRMLVGPCVDGLQFDHLCRVRICVNPDHLERVTGLVNTRRGFGPAGQNARKAFCLHGHAFDEVNTSIGPGALGRPRRSCKACNREKSKRYRQTRLHE